MTNTERTMVAMALIKLLSTGQNREQLTRVPGLKVEPTVPRRIALLLEVLERDEMRRDRSRSPKAGMLVQISERARSAQNACITQVSSSSGLSRS
jgi:hypothetical protein